MMSKKKSINFKFNNKKINEKKIEDIYTTANIFKEKPKQIQKRKNYIRNKLKQSLSLDSYNHPYRTIRQNLIISKEKKPQFIQSYKQIQLMKQLQQSFQIYQNDNQNQCRQFIGQFANINYYKHYKKLNKIKDQNSAFKNQDSTFTAVLKSEQQQLFLPHCIGIIKKTGSKNKINLRYTYIIRKLKLGNTYSKILSKGFQKMSYVDQIDFEENRITDKGSYDILNSLSPRTKKINLKSNQLGKSSIKKINELLIRSSDLIYLNLENNKIGNLLIMQMVDSLLQNYSLSYLNISKNLLNHRCVKAICSIIKNQSSIQQFYLHWNKFNSQSGCQIFTQLKTNNHIKVFDISYNSIGAEDKNHCIPALCSFFENNQTLIHLDLSYNSFNYQSTQILSKSLKKNHSIYGIHFAGNNGYIDALGFLIPTSNILVPPFEGYIQGVSITRHRNSYQNVQNYWKEICWICEGWVQKEFVISKEESTQCWIHYNFQNYSGRYITTNNNGKFDYKTMVPPTDVHFFFTLNDHQKTSLIMPEIQLDKILRINKLTIDQSINYYKENLKILEVNQMVITNPQPIIEQEIYNVFISCLPRIRQYKKYDPQQIQKIKWTFPMSLWYKMYRKQTQQLRNKCFQKDWGQTKIEAIVKDISQINKIKSFLKGHYKKILQIYRYYSAFNPAGDIWSITQIPYTQFCNFIKIVDKTLQLQTVDLIHISSTSSTAKMWQGNPRNPDRGLVRFQFLQSFIRLGHKKYIQTGFTSIIYQLESYFEALQMVFKNYLLPVANQFNYFQWRYNIYYVQENDILIKHYRTALQQCFNKYSVLKVKPGQKKFMCLEQFRNICSICGFFTGKQSCMERDANQAFCYAMMLQIDQLQNQRFFKMSWIEFVEALARVTNTLAPTISSSTVINKEIGQRTILNKRKTILMNKVYFHQRFERAICKVIQTTCCEQTKQKYSLNTIFIS